MRGTTGYVATRPERQKAKTQKSCTREFMSSKIKTKNNVNNFCVGSGRKWVNFSMENGILYTLKTRSDSAYD